MQPAPIHLRPLTQMGRNIIHGSDSVESAMREIALVSTPAMLAAGAACLPACLPACLSSRGNRLAPHFIDHHTLVLPCAQWFKADELADYEPVATPWLYE